MLDLYRRVPEIGCNQWGRHWRHRFLIGAWYEGTDLCTLSTQRGSVQGRGLQEGGCCDCWLVSIGKVGREGGHKGRGRNEGLAPERSVCAVVFNQTALHPSLAMIALTAWRP